MQKALVGMGKIEFFWIFSEGIHTKAQRYKDHKGGKRGRLRVKVKGYESVSVTFFGGGDSHRARLWRAFANESETFRIGNPITAPRQGALTDKCDSLPRTEKATVNSNGSTAYDITVSVTIIGPTPF